MVQKSDKLKSIVKSKAKGHSKSKPKHHSKPAGKTLPPGLLAMLQGGGAPGGAPGGMPMPPMGGAGAPPPMMGGAPGGAPSPMSMPPMGGGAPAGAPAPAPMPPMGMKPPMPPMGGGGPKGYGGQGGPKCTCGMGAASNMPSHQFRGQGGPVDEQPVIHQNQTPNTQQPTPVGTGFTTSPAQCVVHAGMVQSPFAGQGGPEQDMSPAGEEQPMQQNSDGSPFSLDGMGGSGDGMGGGMGDFVKGIAHGIAAGGLLGSMFSGLGHAFGSAGAVGQAGAAAGKGASMGKKMGQRKKAKAGGENFDPQGNNAGAMQGGNPDSNYGGLGMTQFMPEGTYPSGDEANTQSQALGYGAIQPNQAGFGRLSKPAFMNPLQAPMVGPNDSPASMTTQGISDWLRSQPRPGNNQPSPQGDSGYFGPDMNKIMRANYLRKKQQQ